MIAAITQLNAIVWGVAAFVVLCALMALSLIATLFIVACVKLSNWKAKERHNPAVWRERGVRR